MKTIFAAILTFLIAQVASALNVENFLQAIREKEQGWRDGQAGERGVYQFMPGTWRQHTDRPFCQARDPRIAHQVALLHLEWMRRTLRSDDPIILAAAWNVGVTGARRGRGQSYAREVNNLYEQYQRERSREFWVLTQ